jgi:hypothetical protein
MAINANLLGAVKEIVSKHGAETLSDAERVRDLLGGLAPNEPKPQKNALIACLEQGFAAPLQNAAAHERGQVKAKMAERLNRDEGLDLALCTDTVDLLAAALFEAEKNGPAGSGPGKICAAYGAELPAEARFCAVCGAELPAEARFCAACGTELVAGARFCPGCGAATAGGPEPAAASPAPSPESAAPAPESAPAPAASKKKPAQPEAQNGGAWRELQTLKGHTELVFSAAYSPDGSRIVSGSQDKVVRIWDAKSGHTLRKLEGHTGAVRSAAYSPEGSRIVSGAVGGNLKIWDAKNGRELRTLKGHKRLFSDDTNVLSVAYSPDGSSIISGSNDYT